MSTNFLFSKVCWQRPAMFCLYTSSKLSRPWFEFSLKVKVMGSNPGYLLKSFLLYRWIFLFIWSFGTFFAKMAAKKIFCFCVKQQRVMVNLIKDRASTIHEKNVSILAKSWVWTSLSLKFQSFSTLQKSFMPRAEAFKNITHTS